MENNNSKENGRGTLDELIRKSDEILAVLKKLKGEPSTWNLSEEDKKRIENPDFGIKDEEFFVEGTIYEKIYSYDPDSSPVAWEYYKKMYSNNNLISDTNWTKLDNNRKVATFEYDLKNENLNVGQLEKEVNLKIGIINIAGDCVFNFNEKKYNKFANLIKSSDPKKGMYILKLNLCTRMHHSPYNFSLIPSTGGMGNRKESGSGGLDRPDWLLFALQKFYSTVEEPIPNCFKDKNVVRENEYDIEGVISWIRNSQKEGYKIITGSRKKTYEKNTEISLADFLLKIGSVKEYAEFFYHLNPQLLDRMIKSGEKSITEENDLNSYMDLAIEYWEHQAENNKI